MEDQQLNPAESLALIGRMIENTRSRMERNAGRPFLLFGYVTIATALAVWFAVTQTHNPWWQLLWFVITLVAAVYGFVAYRKNRTKKVSTYVDRVVSCIWITGGIIACMQSVIAMFLWPIPILYIIVLVIGMQTALTGLVIRFPLVTIAGFAAIALSPLFLAVKGIDTCLLFAAVFLVMMVIPGHILNYRSNHPAK